VTKNSLKWVLLHDIHSLVHEFRDFFISEIVYHLDFNLLQNLSSLFATLSVYLKLKMHLRGIHINLLDRILVGICGHYKSISMVRDAITNAHLRE